MNQPTTEPTEPDHPAAWALARHIADHPVSTIQAAFRYLNAPLTIELHADPAVSSAGQAPATDPTHGLSVPHADALWDAIATPGPRTATYPEQHERVCRAVRDILDELTPARDEETDQTALREQAAQGIRDAACTGDCGQTEEECRKERIQPFVWHHGKVAIVEGTPEQLADAVLAVLPAPTDRAATLREQAERLSTKANKLTENLHNLAYFVSKDRLREAEILDREATELRRLADETATETPAAEPTAEDIARAHVTSLHLIGEQLATIESWFWEHLADVRDAGARQDQTATETPKEQ
ncbi:hypothetical protein ACPC36_07940 [Streptomyces pseudogriseolus]|uniref:hypothetical protein n=1 Tax=Streptomyces pseudogriseolus TaxID=36817 RepID=UPI003FA2322A